MHVYTCVTEVSSQNTQQIPAVSSIHKLPGLSYDIEYRALPIQPSTGYGLLCRVSPVTAAFVKFASVCTVVTPLPILNSTCATTDLCRSGAVLLRYTLDPSHGFTMTTCRTGATITDDCDGVCLYVHVFTKG